MPTEIDLKAMSGTRNTSAATRATTRHAMMAPAVATTSAGVVAGAGEGTGTVDSIQDENERVWSLHESLVDAAISFLRKVRDANLDLQVGAVFCAPPLRTRSTVNQHQQFFACCFFPR